MPALRCSREPDWLQVNTGGPAITQGVRIDPSREPSIAGSFSGQFKMEYFANLNLSRCFSCKRYAVWLFDKIVWPATSSIVTPQEDMPEEVRTDFLLPLSSIPHQGAPQHCFDLP